MVHVEEFTVRKIAKIPSQLLSRDLTDSLHLNEQSYLMLIPKTLLTCIDSDNVTFDLAIDKGRLTLIGPSVVPGSRASQSVVEDSVT